VSTLGNGGILFVGAAMFVVAIICQRALLRIWKARSASHQEDRPIGGNPFAGFLLVLQSPYLLAIALFVVLLAAATTFLYFEQLRLVQATFANTQDRTKVFAALDWIVQGLTIVCQLFLTGRIASRLGLSVLLAIVPVIMIFGFLSLAAVGTFAVLAVVFVLRRVGEYAFVRPGREILFSRVDNETKYKAKNVIDVPVYRASDAITAQVSTALESGALGTSAVAFIGAVVAVVWAVNGWWLGKRSDARGD
jgi:AAA family ATP:ADP antiporter